MDFFAAIGSNPTVQWVVIGTALLSLLSSMVGVFTFLQKRSLVGDAVSHALLPGICLSFMIQGEKDPWLLLIGAFVSGWVCLILIDLIQKYSKSKPDTAIAIGLSSFFGLGIVLLTAIQNSGNPNQSGLDAFLFGNAASIGRADIELILLVGSFILLSLILGFRGFKALCFDPDFARSGGLHAKILQFWLSGITVLTICLGVQALGVVLMAAMLITPAVAGRSWTNKLGILVLLAGGIGVVSGFGGAWISYTRPAMPTGPWVVCIASVLVFLSLIFAPRRGVVSRKFRALKNQRKILRENILKALYHLQERSTENQQGFTLKELMELRAFERESLEKVLRRLVRKDELIAEAGTYSLSSLGEKRASNIVRNHRLWELYLTEYVGMQADHVHEDAEAMEHLITPEIERDLLRLLDNPTKDPHQREIPKSHA